MHVLYQGLLGHPFGPVSPILCSLPSSQASPRAFICAGPSSWNSKSLNPRLAAHFFVIQLPVSGGLTLIQISAPFSLCKLDLLLFINYFCLSTYLSPHQNVNSSQTGIWRGSLLHFLHPKKIPLYFIYYPEPCRFLRTAVKRLTYLSNAMWQFLNVVQIPTHLILTPAFLG